MPQKITQLPRRDQRLCPWCEQTYRFPPGHTGHFCPQCRSELLEESKEFLVDMLARATGINVVIMEAMPIPAEILSGLELQQKGSGRRLTMKEATLKKHRPQ